MKTRSDNSEKSYDASKIEISEAAFTKIIVDEYLIAIDPGRIFGMAIFKKGVLYKTFEEKNRAFVNTALGLELFGKQVSSKFRFVIELPQIYPIRKWKGDPNDILDIAVFVGVCIGAFASNIGTLDLVRPSEWKGAVPKEIDHKRTLDMLMEKEKEVIKKKKSSHVLDAIGLGLWALGRRKQ
jgi:hypothetical protein